MAEARKRRTGKIAGSSAAIAVALAAAVYLTLGAKGNRGGDAVCASAVTGTAALDPLIHGEIAAFQPAREARLHRDLAFTDADGAPTTLADFRGKVILLNLWATWCAPCREEMPALDRLQQALGGDDFSVVAVSIDTAGPERPAAFLEGVGVKNLPLYTDRSLEIFQALKKEGLALGLPVTLLVDREGCGLGHINGPAVWDSAEAKALIEAAIGEADGGEPPPA